jgi:alpha-galactosidase
VRPYIQIGPLRIEDPRIRLDGVRLRREGGRHEGTPGSVELLAADSGALRLTVKAACERTHSMELAGSIPAPRSVVAHNWHSWNRSSHQRLADQREHRSHGMVAVAYPKRTIALGLQDHRSVFTWFVVQPTRDAGRARLRIEAEIPAGGAELVLGAFAEPRIEAAERAWARWVGDATGRTGKPRRLGWCSWYYNYAWFDGKQVEEYTAKMAPLRDTLGVDVFLIDAGYFTSPGDWLDPQPHRFPKGIKHYAKVIARRGFTPGIWIAPFMVGDRSRLYRQHPDWLCRDEAGRPIPMMRFMGEQDMWLMRDRAVYVLDTSNPAAKAYLRRVLRKFLEYGFRYFKTDFLYWGMLDEIAGTRIARHSPGKTRTEYFRESMEMIREAIGPDSFWSGCGSPLWTACGLIDSNRLTGDTGPVWAPVPGCGMSARSVVEAFSLRNFVGPELYHSDADCVLLRHWEHDWTDEEIISMALYTGMGGGLFLTSDPLQECLPERRGLFHFCSHATGPTGLQPLIAPGDPVIVMVRPGRTAAVLLFNSGDAATSRTVGLNALGLEGRRHAWRWRVGPAEVKAGKLRARLAPHHSALFFLSARPFPSSYRPGSLRGENVGPAGEKRLFGMSMHPDL